MSRQGADLAAEQALVVVDDDNLFCQRLEMGLKPYGITAFKAASREAAFNVVHERQPDLAVLELRLGRDRLAQHSGLELVTEFRQLRPQMRVLIVTSYGSIVTAVIAIKAGAVDYLSKPASVDQVARALLTPHCPAAIPDKPISANRLRWEHILRIFHQCDQNVSETARRLGMHRRTLQRMLNKRPPNE